MTRREAGLEHARHLGLGNHAKRVRGVAGPVVDRLADHDAGRAAALVGVVGQCIQPALAGRQAKREPREHLQAGIDPDPNVVRPRQNAHVGQTGLGVHLGIGLAARPCRRGIMRQEVVPQRVALRLHVGHALDRREVEVEVAVDHADLVAADDLEIPNDRINRRTQVPRGMHKRRVVVFEGADRAGGAELVQFARVDRALHRTLETFVERGGELAEDEKAKVAGLAVVPEALLGRERIARLGLHVVEILVSGRIDRGRIAVEPVSRIVIPRKEDDPPVLVGLLLFGRFHRRLDQVPQVPSPAALPCRLHQHSAVLRGRDGSGEDFLGAARVVQGKSSPLGNVQELVGSTAGA